jgi:hypothetical protein
MSDNFDDDDLRQQKKRRAFRRIATAKRATIFHRIDDDDDESVTASMSRLLSKIDFPQSGNDFSKLVARISSTWTLSAEDDAIFVNVKKNLPASIISSAQVGRRFIHVLSLDWTMVDAPEVPDRMSGSIVCSKDHIIREENLIRVGRAVRDYILWLGMEVLIEIQPDILVKDGRYVVLQEQDGTMNTSDVVAHLFAVIPQAAVLQNLNFQVTEKERDAVT